MPFEIVGDEMKITLPDIDGAPKAEVSSTAYPPWGLRRDAQSEGQYDRPDGTTGYKNTLLIDAIVRYMAGDEDTKGFVRDRKGKELIRLDPSIIDRHAHPQDIQYLGVLWGQQFMPEFFIDVPVDIALGLVSAEGEVNASDDAGEPSEATTPPTEPPAESARNGSSNGSATETPTSLDETLTSTTPLPATSSSDPSKAPSELSEIPAG